MVGSGGYATINAAIAAATPGQTIRIKAGTYAEQVGVTKTLTLTAYGDGPAIVSGGNTRANGLVLDGNAITVRGLTIQNTKGAAILIHGDRATIDGNTIQDFDSDNSGPEADAGIAAYYSGPGQTITNNTITRRVALNGGDNTKGQSNGIYFKSNSTDRASGGGHTITGNRITGGYDCIGGQVEDDAHGSFDGNTLISSNIVDTCYDDGIQAEGGDANVHIQDNIVTHAANGISTAPVLSGPIYIERNTITDGRAGFYGVMNCWKIGNQGHGVAYYTGNRCILPAYTQGGVTYTASGWAQSNPGINPIVARGNTVVVSRYVIEWTSPVESGTSFDGDCLWTSDSGRFIKWPSGQYLTITAWRSATGNEANGTQSATCGQ